MGGANPCRIGDPARGPGKKEPVTGNQRAISLSAFPSGQAAHRMHLRFMKRPEYWHFGVFAMSAKCLP
jgi:hypothetical protein